MKKFISSTLVIVMLLTMMLSGITVTASTSVTFGKSEAVSICSFLADNMLALGSADRRTEASRILSALIESDTGIDSLIEIINSGNIALPENENVRPLIENIRGLSDEMKETITFALNVIKCTEPEKRTKAIDTFYTDASVELTAAESEALGRLFDVLLESTEAKEALETPHSVTAGTLLNLLTPFKGCFTYTDNEVGGKELALKENSVRATFSNKFDEIFAGYTINGTEVSTAKDLLNVVADTVNTELTDDEIADLKLVLGAVDLYEEKVRSSNRRPSGSSTQKPVKPEEPTDEPKDEPTYVPEAEVIPAPEEFNEEYVFDDTENHWAKAYIAKLAEIEIFKGYEDGSFKPDTGITREEMAAVIIRVLDKEANLGTAPATTFDDNDTIAEWAKDYVNLTVKKGIYTGYDDNEFKPKRVITREELVAILMRSVEGNKMLEELTYEDLEHIGEWSMDYVNRATAKGIISGYEDGTFRPRNSVTRAEAAKMIYNFMYVKDLFASFEEKLEAKEEAKEEISAPAIDEEVKSDAVSDSAVEDEIALSDAEDVSDSSDAAVESDAEALSDATEDSAIEDLEDSSDAKDDSAAEDLAEDSAITE